MGLGEFKGGLSKDNECPECEEEAEKERYYYRCNNDSCYVITYMTTDFEHGFDLE